jgi:hypothetical protein
MAAQYHQVYTSLSGSSTLSGHISKACQREGRDIEVYALSLNYELLKEELPHTLFTR